MFNLETKELVKELLGNIWPRFKRAIEDVWDFIDCWGYKPLKSWDDRWKNKL